MLHTRRRHIHNHCVHCVFVLLHAGSSHGGGDTPSEAADGLCSDHDPPQHHEQQSQAQDQAHVSG